MSSAALLGAALTTLAVGFLAARYDLRKLLLLGGVPRRAVVDFRGDDPRDGPLIRYTAVTRIARTAL